MALASSQRRAQNMNRKPIRVVNGARIAEGRPNDVPVAWLIVSDAELFSMLKKSAKSRTRMFLEKLIVREPLWEVVEHRIARAGRHRPPAAAALAHRALDGLVRE